MNVLLSAVGRRAYLVDYFRRVVSPLGGKVFATNTHPDATGFFMADSAAIVPPSASSDYVDVMVELCKKWSIKLLFSLHDWDAPVIAANRERFLEIGTLPVMPSSDIIATCLDKYATYKKMLELGIPSPTTVLSIEDALDLLKFPMIVKPRWGQGSLGLFKVDSKEELEWAYNLSHKVSAGFARACPFIDGSQAQVLIQECVVGEEFGCDIVNNLKGEFRQAFVKRKFAMRSGETDAAETVEQPKIGECAKEIALWSRHLGNMDSDWLVDSNGKCYLLEVNPRFGGGYPFTHSAGANVPLACVNWALGNDSDEWRRDYKVGVKVFKGISLIVKNA